MPIPLSSTENSHSPSRRDAFTRILGGAVEPEFQGVADQVLQQLLQLRLISVHHWQDLQGDVGLGFFDSRAQSLDHLAGDGGRRRWLQSLRRLPTGEKARRSTIRLCMRLEPPTT